MRDDRGLGVRIGLRVGACLSLTGRFARFGTQAAAGLAAWRSLAGDAELLIEDDGSDPARLAGAIRSMAARCDLLLGPYSTQLMRSAARALADGNRLIWNHGGAGDDVCAMLPGRMVSVLTPAGRYAEPFMRGLAASEPLLPLRIAAGRGSFGRQVAAGAAATARALGLPLAPEDEAPAAWDLLSAGVFEDDVAAVARALAESPAPRMVCSVAAGVREFGRALASPAGVFGIAQWFPGAGGSVEVGPGEADLLGAVAGPAPDYPAVQAVAAAALAVHCARLAGETGPGALWQAAAALDTTTLFGRFRIDPETGVQVAHETVLVRWGAKVPGLVRAGRMAGSWRPGDRREARDDAEQ
jgi:hypothetical protein